MSRDPIIEPTDVPALGTFLLLDVRDPAAFAAGHPTRAVRVPIELWGEAAKSSETSLDNVAWWEHAVGELGIDGTLKAVIYDNGRLTEAARVWFILQYLGADAFILNGGWPAIETRSDLLGAAQEASGTATFHARPGTGPVGLVDRQALKGALGGALRIFDARTADEFSGEDLRRNARGGHLPGARLVPHANLLDGGRLRSSGDLRDLLGAAGFQSGDHIVTHCDGGGRAALAAAAAVRAGYDDVRAYYLSFSDWSEDESCPIVRD